MGWLAGGHIIGLILWVGGLFTLARLMGAHVAMENADARKALCEFERKTYFMAVMPGFLLALVTGLTLMVSKGMGLYFAKGSAWGATFHVKMTLVVILIVIDQLIAAKMRKLHKEDTGSRAFFMATHGIVALIMIIIVLMVKTNILGA